MNVIYNINNPRGLNLGHQYDHNVKTVTFAGFTPVDETNAVYLKFEGLGLYPLADMSFNVSKTFTMKTGEFSGQLLEVASDDSVVQNSNIFKMTVEPSLTVNKEIVKDEASLDLWFSKMSDLYQLVKAEWDKYEAGELITKDIVVDALGYLPADVDDVPIVPDRVSAFENDSEYISGISSEDVLTALGYTPVKPDDIPIIPSVVSAFDNDSGYITGITAEQVINALGYKPMSLDSAGAYKLKNSITLSTASNVIVISEDSKTMPLDLDGLVVVIQNPNGIQGGANGYMYVYDADDNVIGGRSVFICGGTNILQAVIKVEVKGDITEMMSVGWTKAAPYAPGNKTLICETGQTGRISKMELVGNGQQFSAGTTVKLFGYSTD